MYECFYIFVIHLTLKIHYEESIIIPKHYRLTRLLW